MPLPPDRPVRPQRPVYVPPNPGTPTARELEQYYSSASYMPAGSNQLLNQMQQQGQITGRNRRYIMRQMFNENDRNAYRNQVIGMRRQQEQALRQVARDSKMYSVPRDQAMRAFGNVDGFDAQGDNVLVPAPMFDNNPEFWQANPANTADQINGIDADVYNALPKWKQTINNLMPSGSVVGSAATGAVTGFLGSGGNIAGAALGAGLGGTIGAAGTSQQVQASPFAQGAMQVMDTIFNTLVNSSRGLYGILAQGFGEGIEATQRGGFGAGADAVANVLNHLPEAYQAAQTAYGIAFLPNEGTAINLRGPDTTFQIDPTRAPSTVLLQEAREAIINGATLEQVEDGFRQRFGIRYDVADLAGELILDPLNLLPLVEVMGLAKLAQAKGELQLAESLFKQAEKWGELKPMGRLLGLGPGTMDAFREFSATARLLPVSETKALGRAARTIAGLDANGIPKEYSNVEKARGIQNLFGLTPQSKANTTLIHLTEGLDNVVNDVKTPDQLLKVLRSVARMPIQKAVGDLDADVTLPKYFDSAEAQPIPQAMKDVLPAAEEKITNYNLTEPSRTMLERLAQDLTQATGKQTQIQDVIRQMGDADDVDTQYRAVMQTLQEAVEAGTLPKAEMDYFLQTGGKNLADAAKLFTGKDGLPFNMDLLKVHVMETVAQGIENWAVKYFKIKKMHWAERASNAVKSFQAATLLNTPTFAATNILTNIATMAWDGVLPGFRTWKGMSGWLGKMGYNTGLMRKGGSAASLGEVGAHLEAAAEIQKGRKGYQLGEIIRKTRNGEDVGAPEKFNFLQKMSVFPRLSQKLESMSSGVAYYSAVRPYWDRIWKAGDGFDPMGKEFRKLAEYLDAIQPGTSRQIEKMIAKGKSRAEIEEMIFSGFNPPALKDVLSADELDGLNLFPGLVDEMDAQLRDAKTAADVHQVFQTFKNRLVAEARNETIRRAKETADRVATRVNVEGMKGGLDEFDSVVNLRQDTMLKHFEAMDEVSYQASLIADKKARAAYWTQHRIMEDQRFRAIEDDEAARWLGLFRGLNAEETTEKAILALLGEGSGDTMGLHSNWRQYFDMQRQEFDNYRSLMDTLDENALALEWEQMSQRLNDTYIQAVIEEDKIMGRIDELFARSYERRKLSPESYAEAMNWRLALREKRRQQAAVMVFYRTGQMPRQMADWKAPAEILRTITTRTGGKPIYTIKGKPYYELNHWFYKEVYTPFIRQIMDAGHENAPGSGPEIQPRGPQGSVAKTMNAELRRMGYTQGRINRMEMAEKQAIIKGNVMAPIAQAAADVKARSDAVWKRVAELKPELAGASEAGFDRTAKLNLIKYLRKNNPGAGVKRFEDITPEAVEIAVRNEELRKQSPIIEEQRAAEQAVKDELDQAAPEIKELTQDDAEAQAYLDKLNMFLMDPTGFLPKIVREKITGLAQKMLDEIPKGFNPVVYLRDPITNEITGRTRAGAPYWYTQLDNPNAERVRSALKRVITGAEKPNDEMAYKMKLMILSRLKNPDDLFDWTTNWYFGNKDLVFEVAGDMIGRTINDPEMTAARLQTELGPYANEIVDEYLIRQERTAPEWADEVDESIPQVDANDLGEQAQAMADAADEAKAEIDIEDGFRMGREALEQELAQQFSPEQAEAMMKLAETIATNFNPEMTMEELLSKVGWKFGGQYDPGAEGLRQFAQVTELHPWVEAAVNHFGTTNNIREAGYILPDGRMLDLTGRHYASGYKKAGNRYVAEKDDYLRNTRSVDHRELPGEFNAPKEMSENPNADMLYFMQQTGAVRIDYASGMINLNGQITNQQARILQDYFSSGWIEVDDPKTGRQIFSEEFDGLGSRRMRALLARADSIAKGEADAGLFQLNQPAPVWYSQLSRTVQSIPMERMTVGQLRGAIAKGAVKADELKWTGLDEWMAQKGDNAKITRAEVMEFLDQNNVRVEERLRSNQHDKIIIDGGDFYAPSTQYSQYTLPGGQNYRELLFTLPIKRTPIDGYDIWSDGKHLGWFPTQEAARAEADRRGLNPLRDYNIAPRGNNLLEDSRYTSPHWSEPNVLAHVRFDERIDADGKRVLFVEEVQSDWHQAGREIGYKDQNSIGEINQIENRLREISPFYTQGYLPGRLFDDWFGPNDRPEKAISFRDGEKIKIVIRGEGDKYPHEYFGGDFRSYDEVAEVFGSDFAELAKMNEKSYPYNGNLYFKIPDDWSLRKLYDRSLGGSVFPAPFSKTWPDLVMKRMIRWAAENGFDRVAWTPGKMQADRYNLAKQVDAINWTRHEDGTYDLSAVLKNQGGTQNLGWEVPAEKLPDLIGKDAANKIVNDSTYSGTLAGESDLEVGGEGMKSFYDVMLPATVQKYVKKWGATVGETRIPKDNPGYDIINTKTGANYATFGSEESALMAIQGGIAEKFGVSNDDVIIRRNEPNKETVHSFDVTPAMRESVLQGQPLFQQDFTLDAAGLTTFSENMHSLIRVFETGNISTVAHELIHGITPYMAQVDADVFRQLWSDLDLPEDWHMQMIYTPDGKQMTPQYKDAYERLSNSFERYMRNGEAPNAQIESVFVKFKNWLRQIYTWIKGGRLDVKVPDEAKAVFDKWLGGSDVEPTKVAEPLLQQNQPSLWDAARAKKAARPQQQSMFQQGEDLPLFSGTAQRAEGEVFAPEETGGQGTLFDTTQQVPTIKPKIAGDIKPFTEQDALFQRTDRIGALTYMIDEKYQALSNQLDELTLAYSRKIDGLVKDQAGYDIRAANKAREEYQAERARIEAEMEQIIQRRYPEGLPQRPEPQYFDKDGNQVEPGFLYQPNDFPLGTADEMMDAPTGRATLEYLNAHVLPMLNKAEGDLAGQMGTPNRVLNLDRVSPEANRELRKYLGKVYGQMGDAKMAALRVGEAKRNFALLDYGKRYNADTALQAIMPYEFWYTRSMLNWAVRALNRPMIAANYYRLMKFFQEQQEKNGFPNRLKKKSFMRMPFLPEWMGEGVYFDPQRYVFPFTQLMRPVEMLNTQANQEYKRASTLVQQMAEGGEISAEDAQEALTSMSGATWQKALAQARQEMDREIQNPMDFAFMMVSPSLPVGIAYNLLRGKPQNIQQLGITRGIQATTAALGIGGPRGINLEGPLRKTLGLPVVDKYEDYRVDRMLANLTAEGLITTDEALRAMIDRDGAAFDLAQRRVSILGGYQYWGGPIGVDFFPEGEQEQRQLKTEYDAAMKKLKEGDKTALQRFYDTYPEYEARRASWEEPEGRLRNFLISEIWQGWNDLPSVHKDEVKEQLGDLFNDGFLTKETRSYDSIDLETLAMWSKLMGRVNPDKAPDVPNMPLKLSPDADASAVEEYYQTSKRMFPGIGNVLNDYYDMTPEQQAAYKLDHPEIDRYYRWKNSYLAGHQSIIPYITSEMSDLYGLPADVQAQVYQFRGYKDTMFPNVSDLESQYFEMPENQRKAYLAKNPMLKNYWDWKTQYAATFTKAAPYILSDQSMQNKILGYKEYNPSVLGNITPLAMRQLYDYAYGGEMRQTAYQELYQTWVNLGKPEGTFSEWLKKQAIPEMLMSLD